METDKLSNLETTWTEFDPNLTVANTTYVVTLTHVINTNVYLESNVTLIFMGGMITGNGTLKGNNTFLVAPITQIFSSDLNITGSWIMDRAYPQWFGAKNDGITDSSQAINKAINLKRVGEVFIPRGEYVVSSSIMLKFGVILCGEKAWEAVDPNEQNDDIYLGTAIRPSQSANFIGDFMILVNTLGPNPETAVWVQSYPDILTSVRNIFFKNDTDIAVRGVLFAGCFEIDHCRWSDFPQAVASAEQCYSDNKVITNCVYSCRKEFSNSYYAFDLSGLGDNLCFTGNLVDLYSTNDALHISFCTSGEVCRNIINSNVKIENSKGITFSSNHCEGLQTQVYISKSSIDISNCYFEKGTLPTLRIEVNSPYNDISVINLDNCAFVYYEAYFDSKSGTVEDGNGCLFDIQTDGEVSLNISNSFRYWLKRGLAGKMYIYGLSTCDSNNNPIHKFNEYSYMLSTTGIMTPTMHIPLNSIATINRDISFFGMLNGQVYWKRDINTAYTYQAQVIWDLDRTIINEKTSIGTYKPNELREGVLIGVFGGNQVGNHYYVRFYRSYVQNGIQIAEYVDIPTCGSQYYYDNGDSICGYKWQNGNSELNSYLILGSIQFIGENVICRSETCPSSGNWKDGDIVYNMGSSSCVMWIRINNSWVER